MTGDGKEAAGRWRQRWRRVLDSRVTLMILLLALLLTMALALWLKQRGDHAYEVRHSAEVRRVDTLVELIATRQSHGEAASAAALAASEPALPLTFRANAALASYERATLVDASRLPVGQSFDVDWLQAPAGASAVFVTWGWYSGVDTIGYARSPSAISCGFRPGAPRLRLSPDGHWFTVQNSITHETALLTTLDCDRPNALLSRWSQHIARQQSVALRVSALLPLPGPKLLLGWTDGRVEMLREAIDPLPVSHTDSPIVGLLTTTDASRFAVLTRSGVLSLIDPAGRSLAPPMKLERDRLSTTENTAWTTFVHDVDGMQSHAVVLDQAAFDGKAAAVLALFSQGTAAAFALHDQAATDPPLLDVAVTTSANTGCAHLDMASADRLASMMLEARCRTAGNPVQRLLFLPTSSQSSMEEERGYASATFCESGATLVLGTWRGDVVWMRHITDAAAAPPRIDIEHVEHAWNDPVTALACRQDGSVQAGFRNAGIKAFRPVMRLQQTVVGIRGAKEYAEVLSEDQSWAVDTMRGPARLEFENETGELVLLRQGRSAWRQRPTEPSSDRPGLASEKITAVVIDGTHARVWVLTTFGRVSLLELNTGAVLARFSTSYFAASPNKEVALERPVVDASGQFSFVHRVRDRAVKVSIDEGAR